VLSGLTAGRAESVLAQPASAQNRRPPHAIRRRARRLLDEGWLFARDDGDAAHHHAAIAWRPAPVPHLDAGHTTGGAATPIWYRRNLRMPETWRGRRLFLHFEGAGDVAEVYVDGVRAGGHAGGATAFSLDVTEPLRLRAPGAEATVTVRVAAPAQPGPAVHRVGLHRNVWFVATEEVHLDLLDSPGVQVETADLDAARALVRVRGRVVNDADTATTARVRSRVLDAGGVVVADAQSEVALAARATARFELELPAIAHPHLWSTETPYLYRVSTVVDSGHGRDRVDVPLGLRHLAADATGFRLNGAPYRLAPTGLHEGAMGRHPHSDAARIQGLRTLKGMGVNVVRMPHDAQSATVLEAADELGLLVWQELPPVRRATLTGSFAADHLGSVREMVRQRSSHPSVAVWGTSDELALPGIGPAPQPGDLTHEMVRLGDELVRAEDPSRPTASAGADPVAGPAGWVAALYQAWTLSRLYPSLALPYAKQPGRPARATHTASVGDSANGVPGPETLVLAGSPGSDRPGDRGAEPGLRPVGRIRAARKLHRRSA
ncbi:hypothetical protein GB882_11045, partial [Georgenia ruanii]|nr:hypothetical protein [Georgenia ruanii]